MIIDGERLSLKCKRCGEKYSWILGYGPICPSPELREQKLKEHPPRCPKCGAMDFERQTLGSVIKKLFGF